jgi:maltooligosyltrehalose trehalohydrolase
MSNQVRLWAPNAGRVELLVEESRVELLRESDGWWAGPMLAAGDYYAFSINAGPPRPDPRSRWQPDGVHGRSRWLDLEALRSPAANPVIPLRDALIYELHVGTFSAAGTFTGAIPHLDHLVQLGVTHVELMPIAQFSGVHGWGYDGVDLFAAHEPYGGPIGLRELIGACHERKLAVLIDVVPNHFGPDGAYLRELGPYTHENHTTPWGEAVNLDGDGSREVRRFLIESCVTWLRDYGADGLRLDAIHALRDTSERHFVAELTDTVHSLERELGRRLVLIGEYDEHDPLVVTERAADGWGLDAHWNDDFHHAVHALLVGEHTGYYQDFADRSTLVKVIEQGYVLDGCESPFRACAHGKPFGAQSRDRLVAYIQSHDQIGNRAAGERLHHLCGPVRTRIAAALLFTSPFVPMIFQGEEWAASTPFCYFADHESEELRRAVREGRRAEHALAGWTGPEIDPIDPETRTLGVLRWDERGEPEHRSMLAWYRALADARKAMPALRDAGPTATRARFEGEVLVVERGPFKLTCNLCDEPVRTPLGDVVLASDDRASTQELPAWSCALSRD